MFGLAIALGIDALILMFLLQLIVKENVDFGPAFFLALCVSMAAILINLGLSYVVGEVGILLSALIVAVVLGIAVSALYGAEIKRSFLVGAAFVVVHCAVFFGLGAIFHA